MLRVDGSMGEAGGQVLRSALAVSLLTREPLRIFDIRKGRPKPGLAAQHLSAVRAAAAVSRGEVTGDRLRSTELVLRPRAVVPADYHFDVGTAGSATLVVQTIAAALLSTGGASSIVVQGGTHNPMAPPFEFLREVWAPTLGAPCGVSSSRVGLYPRGGGALRVELGPSAAQHCPIELTSRGRLVGHELRAILAGVPSHVGERELRTYIESLGGLSPEIAIAARVDDVGGATGPGNVLVATLRFEKVAHVVVAFGERGVPAEVVATKLAAEVRALFEADVPVDEHLADQLLLPMVFGAGGEYVTTPLSRHTTTQIALLHSLVGAKIDVAPEGRRVRVIVREGVRGLHGPSVERSNGSQ
jgi:RNA 3'-terminal phosphate cyclase (ATP)